MVLRIDTWIMLKVVAAPRLLMMITSGVSTLVAVGLPGMEYFQDRD